MDLSCTVSEINDISVENRKIFPPRLFNAPPAPADGFPLE